MAKKFVRTTKSVWDAKADKSDYNDSIVFIEDSGEIWSNDLIYGVIYKKQSLTNTTITPDAYSYNEYSSAISNLNITLNTTNEIALTEYIFLFTPSSESFSLTINGVTDIRWRDSEIPTWDTSKTYIISIIKSVQGTHYINYSEF